MNSNPQKSPSRLYPFKPCRSTSCSEPGRGERRGRDLDATDDRPHGLREGRFLHGCYDCYRSPPPYAFCGGQLLAARLWRSNTDASAGAVEMVARIVDRVHARWPKVEIPLRAGLTRE